MTTRFYNTSTEEVRETTEHTLDATGGHETAFSRRGLEVLSLRQTVGSSCRSGGRI